MLIIRILSIQCKYIQHIFSYSYDILVLTSYVYDILSQKYN